MFGRMARYSAVIGLASGLALIGGAGSAQAQMWGGWFGGWRAAPGPYASPIPPRRVAGIVASEGYALNGTPRRDGDVIIADGVDPRGQHVHFVIDAYDGEILRSRVAGPPRPPGFVGNPEAAPQAHAALVPNQVGSGAGTIARPPAGQMLGGAQPGLEPPHPLAKPKAAAKPKQTAAHNPAKPAAAPIPPPSEAEKVTAPAPTAHQEPASPAPAAEARAPETLVPTPLAPDAAPASGPAAPAPAAVEAKAPVPQATPDIGPAVKKVDPAPTASIPAPATSSAPDFTDESK
jgi:hypothetical protein